MTGEPGIRLQGVTKTFNHRGDPVQAVAGVDLEVAEGEFVSIIGPSGCGKSTLLRLVAGLIDADDGRVTVGGLDPRAARRAKRFGLVPQTPALLPWRSVRDNVTLLDEVNRRGRGPASGVGKAADDAAVDALIEAVGLRGFERARPAELSGGMQQRVALARAFALGAPVLLMDEPFAALDEITRETMRFLLAEIWARSTAGSEAAGPAGAAHPNEGRGPAGSSRTVLFVTHTIPEAVILSDRVVVLSARPGRVTLVEDITLGRPRTAAMEDSVEFLRHTRMVREALAQAHAHGPPPRARSA